MITVDFSKRGQTGLCDYLILSLKQQITSGDLPPDSRLPSKRSLAQHLGISVITVQNAYSILISEGYIYSIEKKGFFVTDIKSIKVNSAPQDKEEKTDIMEENKDKLLCDFASNSIATSLFPFTQWAHTMRKVLTTADPALLEKENVSGSYELRKSISRHLKDFRNIDVKSEQIVIGAGTESLYSMIVQFMGHDKTYAVENPGYSKVSSIIRLNGASCHSIKMDKDGLDISELKRKNACIVHVSPSHHFPTGCVMPIKRRNELLQWAYDAQDRYIIEDDYDSEFRFTGKPLMPLFAMDKGSRVIYINTFSKTLSPSFRISYMILPVTMVSDFHSKLGFYSCPVSSFEQYTLSLFITEGFYEKHIIRMKNYYRNLRNLLIESFIKSPAKDLIEIKEEESGLHFIMYIRGSKNTEEIHKKLLSYKINMPLLRDYYDTDEEDTDNREDRSELSGFLINYSGIQKSDIPRIVDLISHCILQSPDIE